MFSSEPQPKPIEGNPSWALKSKASNKIHDQGRKAKEGLGKVTGDRDTETEARSTRRSHA